MVRRRKKKNTNPISLCLFIGASKYRALGGSRSRLNVNEAKFRKDVQEKNSKAVTGSEIQSDKAVKKTLRRGLDPIRKREPGGSSGHLQITTRIAQSLTF